MSLLRKILDLRGRAPDEAAVAQPPGKEVATQWRSRGNAALAAGRLDEAGECYRQAAAADPSDALARLNLGFVILELGDAAGALRELALALSLKQRDQDILHEIQYLLGRAYAQQGDAVRAVASFEAAAQAAPGFAEPIEALVHLHRAANRHEEWLRWAQRLSGIRPSAAANLAVGQALLGLRRYPEALSAFDAALRQDPQEPNAWTGRGNAMLAMGQPQEALEAFQRAVAIVGPVADAVANAGAALSQCGRSEEALESFEAALRFESDNRTALVNRASVLVDLLRIDEAIHAGQQGLAVYPEDADLHWTLAIALLLSGRLKEGWAEHEWRWHSVASRARDPLVDDGRRWTGAEDLRGKTILLFAEQGLGDTIQMLRYVPLVAARAGRVLLHLPDKLHGLRLTQDIAEGCTLLPPGEALATFHFHCPLLSLPFAFGSEEADLPGKGRYLGSAPDKADRWRMRLAETGPGLKVGVVWSGSPTHVNDHNRSIALETLRQIDSPGCVFVSLQPQVRDSDRGVMRQWAQLLPWGEELADFDETAALVDALDLVVSVDTSVAHLAGALGRPVLVLLPHCPDWRWMLHREDSPWYPTARLLRQERARDWDGVLERVREELQRREAQTAAPLLTTPASA